MRGSRGIRLRLLLPALLAAALAAACEVEWGGAEVGLETPRPRGAGDTVGAGGTPADLPPLPDGPLLHVVRVERDGRAVTVPAARMTAAGPAALDLPADPPDRWWARFADRHQAPGTELPLYATGRRIGTLILGERREAVNAGCPQPMEGRVLLPPGTGIDGLAFAWEPVAGESPPGPRPPVRPSSTRRLRTFGPILAERLLEEAGVERPYLARPAELKPVAFAGDTAAGMAATYLIGDTLAPVPPRGSPSSSLFFLARYAPAEGYVPVWSRTSTYGDSAGKVILSHVDWLPAAAGRVDVLRRTDARSSRLAAARTEGEGADGELDWTAPARCPVLNALEGPGAGLSAAPGGGTTPEPGS